MRRSSTIPAVTFAFLVLLSRSAFAVEFPFDAIINIDEALVWSGTGGKETDYATMKLRRGDKVRVLHQEFGGWYKIAPPEGSFSWIRDDLIERTGDRGVVTKDTMDIIGSEIGTPQFEVRNLLRQGEVVEILSRPEELERGPRSTPMLRVKPPRGEFRFIRQRDLVPASEFVAEPAAGSAASSPSGSLAGTAPRDEINPFAASTPDPFKELGEATTSKPVVAGEPDLPGQLPGGANFELARTAPSEAASGTTGSRSLPGSAAEGISMKEFGFAPPGLADPTVAQMTDEEKKQIEAAWDELKTLDAQFQDMRQKPVIQWQIPELKRRYEALQKIPDSFVRRQVERRLAGLQRYEQVYQEIAEVQELLRRTEEKDEQIRQSYLRSRQSVAMQQPVTTTVRPGPAQPPVDPFTSNPQSGFAASPQPLPGPQPQPGTSAPIVRQPAQPSRFDGAGIIQRAASARGDARHVLLGLDGRILAYLQGAPGINLDRFLGQSMGLSGPRQFRRDLNTDFMVVRQLTPVRLQP